MRRAQQQLVSEVRTLVQVARLRRPTTLAPAHRDADEVVAVDQIFRFAPGIEEREHRGEEAELPPANGASVSSRGTVSPRLTAPPLSSSAAWLRWTKEAPKCGVRGSAISGSKSLRPGLTTSPSSATGAFRASAAAGLPDCTAVGGSVEGAAAMVGACGGAGTPAKVTCLTLRILPSTAAARRRAAASRSARSTVTTAS